MSKFTLSQFLAKQFHLVQSVVRCFKLTMTTIQITGNPSLLTATTLSPSSIRLNWTIGSVPYHDHSIERSLDLLNWSVIGSVGTGISTYDDNACDSGRVYYYRVRAYWNEYYSGYSNIAYAETLYLPDDLNDLEFWFDVPQLTGLNDNDLLASVPEFSGNNRTLTNAGGVTRPAYKTNIINNLPVLRGNGTSNWLRSNFNMIQPFTIYIVAVARESDFLMYPYLYVNVTSRLIINAGAVLQMINTPTSTQNVPIIVSAVFNGANSLIGFNSGYITTGNAGAANYIQLRLLAYQDTGSWLDGDEGECALFSGAHDMNTRRRIEEYLSWKWGISLIPLPNPDVFIHALPSIIYVSPDGTGDGSTALTPIEFQAALISPNVIPGDTIMMLDGTYTGNYYSTITGTAANNIYIKPQNYMQAIIDGSFQIGDFTGAGAYTILRNIEATNSDTWRGTWATPQATITRAPNIFPVAEHCKIINCMYHDGGVGIPAYDNANDLVVYGNIGFNNGWADDVQGGAQNIYAHSLDKVIKHNVFAGAFKKTVAIYTTHAIIENITLEENVVFARTTCLFGGNHGAVVSGSLMGNHVLPSGIQLGYVYTPNENIICNNNRVYGADPLTASYFKNLTLQGNKFTGWESSGNGWIELNYTTEREVYDIDNNEFHKTVAGGTIFLPGGTFAGWQAEGFDAHGSYDTNLPVVNELFVYPNEYPDADDKRMGMVVIWNWEGLNNVTVDLTSLGLQVGTTYRWRQAQDPLVDIGTWLCAGNNLTFAMTGHTVALPIGFTEELVPTQFPRFGCFIIEKV